MRINRNPSTHTLYARGSEPALLLGRGFTGHEHLPWFGLINMNARLYDPVLGRFLSPDPYVQSPGGLQNHNRYSYCLNNPLKYTDRSGELFGIDDLIVSALGFVTGYFSHGFSTWLGYNTLGSTQPMAFAKKHVLNTVMGHITPTFNINVGDFNFSINPMSMLTTGAMSGANGLSIGASTSIGYNIGDWNLNVGMMTSGSTTFHGGVSYFDGDFGASWHTTQYSRGLNEGEGSQRTATVGLKYKDWSISHENDVDFIGGDGDDRFRSAALEVGYKDWSIGTNVYTNQINKKSTGQTEKGDTYYKGGKQMSSPFYIGKKSGNSSMKIGFEHEVIGERFQNDFHRLCGYSIFKNSDVK